MNADFLSEREQQVLEAVIRTFVETAEPAGSRTVARHFPLGVSPATIRNTMADLEEKGFLFHPHTSAGRIPTDRAYRFYVNTLMRPVRLKAAEQKRLRRELMDVELTPLEHLIRQAAHALGLLTGELGVAISPRPEETTLERLELISVSAGKVLLVLKLKNGLVRTVYVDLPVHVPGETLVAVTMVLNERLAGQTLAEIRRTLPERLRDSAPGDDPAATDLLNIFVESAEDLFDWSQSAGNDLHLGRTSVLAQQPEFASGQQLRGLIELTERRDLLTEIIAGREHETSLKITIGGEHEQPELSGFTVVTSQYRIGHLSGVIGVIGPTRMPYEKIAAIVGCTSALVSELMTTPADHQEPRAD